MDNVTHTLFALTLAETPLGRRPGARAALVIACNAPDIDAVSALHGTAAYLRWHRGPTHSLAGVVVLGAATAALVAGVGRLRASRARGAGAPTASFSSLLGVATLGVLSHVLMDLPTSYGTRLLSPFDWHWFALDWLPIVDIYLLIVLAAGLAYGRLTPHTRRHNAALALALMAGLYTVRGVAHHRALALAPRLFGPTLPHRCEGSPTDNALDSWPRPPVTVSADGRRCLVEVAAMPTFFSPFRWRVVAQLSNAYELHDLDLLEARFRREATGPEALWRTARLVPNRWTPAVYQAAQTPLARTFLGFSRFPAVRTLAEAGGATTVRWTDMRFAGGLVSLNRPPPRPSPFTVVVRVGPSGRILSQDME
jgi:inner membrane protein